MDLFGDLPTPAGKKASTGDSDDLFGGLPAAASAAGGETKKQLADNENKKSAPTKDAKEAATSQGQSSTAASNKRKPTSASLVSAVGKAGTSFAFVPHAISQARKKKKITQPLRPKVALNKMNPEAVHQPPSNTKENEMKPVAREEGAKDYESKQVTATVEQSTAAQSAQQHEHKILAKTDDNEQSFEEPYLENEPESIRLLHESVTPENAYNPHFPNDYLAHIERKKTERIQKELQQSALQRLDQQEKLRKKIEEERKKIESSGDVNRIVEMRSGGLGGMTANDETNGVGGAGRGRGRGRGRGVQNLPAWLIKKQQEQQLQRAVKGSSDMNAAVAPGQFGNAEDGIN